MASRRSKDTNAIRQLRDYSLADFGCHTSVQLPEGTAIHVNGVDADEVEKVSRALVGDLRKNATVDEFIEALDTMISDAAVPDGERSRLRALRDAARGVSQELLSSVIAHLIERRTGL